jgi:glycosyltransferase involved in cell wall biosynthesis
MRIAQISPLFESCPPQLYGGTERVVSYLTEELVRLRHEVVLFASGDSVTEARLEAPCPSALRLAPCGNPLAQHMIHLSRVARMAGDFDILHFHTDYLHFPLFVDRPVKSVTTLHGRLDLPELPAVFAEFPELRLISISDAQRAPVPWANWTATVNHGLPLDLYREGAGEGGYLAFLGRFSPEKGADRAIEIARRCGMHIKLAAKVDPADEAYFAAVIRPLLDQPHVEYIGEIGEQEKQEFLGKAAALLFPIDWPEPFGLVMIEALAVGTPILAFRRGSVPEIIDHGITGIIVDSIDEAVACVDRAMRLDRHVIRNMFEQRFSVERMAEDYVAVYRRILGLAPQAVAPARAGLAVL